MDGRLALQRKLKGQKETVFFIDIATGKNTELNEDIIRMETKVVSKGAEAPALGSQSKFLRDVDAWLERSHAIISPFFSTFVLPPLMKKFKAN
jgi:hypothetical protein